MTGKPLRLLSVGKLKVPFWKDAAAHYSQRINRWRRLECVEVRDGDPALPQAQRNELEGRRLLEALGPQDVPLVLDELAECVTGAESPETDLLKKELTTSLNRFLRKLAVQDRTVFLLRYYYADTLPEIAQKAGLSANQVKYILQRTRKNLAKTLKQEGLQ